jgi:hypothetical protein
MQPREASLRLVRQHDHGILSGEFASRWRGFAPEPAPLPFDLVLAIALHDYPWIETDEEPVPDPDTGLPHDFLTFPPADRYRMYDEGLDALEHVHAGAALLAGMHYGAFVDRPEFEWFRKRQQARSGRLADELSLSPEEREGLDRRYRFLMLFDDLSLFVCLTPPGVEEGSKPDWLAPDRIAVSPDGERFGLEWVSENELRVNPFPFEEPFEVRIPYRELPPGPYAEAAALSRAWRTAGPSVWRVRVTT